MCDLKKTNTKVFNMFKKVYSELLEWKKKRNGKCAALLETQGVLASQQIGN